MTEGSFLKEQKERDMSFAMGLLLVILVTLKATGVIALAWVWVLAPFWAPIGLWCAFMGFCFAMALYTGQMRR